MNDLRINTAVPRNFINNKFVCTRTASNISFCRNIRNKSTFKENFWNKTEKFLYKRICKLKLQPFSDVKNIREIEQFLFNNGVNVRFGSNLKLAEYVKNAVLNILKQNYPLPKNILFMPSIISFIGIRGMTYRFQNHDPLESPVILPNNIAKLKQAGNNGYHSTDSPYHTFYHEAGHYYHMLNNYDVNKNCKIWAKYADTDLISEIVSKRATALNDGSEFCAEVFAGIIDGKKYPTEIWDLSKKLN